ncbi:MAG TPA: cysteine dioxygenase family protein [Jatrophihabitantaceae bacterium]|jgi:predicted metal-dependent enzyme (double-stranded beta helix superfamily)
MTATLTTQLDDLVAGLRATITSRTDDGHITRRVADRLRKQLPGPDILTPAQREGDPAHYRSHLLHAEADGSFSVVALVWLPGQATRIHDHISWCVFGVIQGIEHEELFDEQLNPLGENDNCPGDVSGFAPPGDIHRVRNIGDITAISLHVYGADLSQVGTSVRRNYD